MRSGATQPTQPSGGKLVFRVTRMMKDAAGWECQMPQAILTSVMRPDIHLTECYVFRCDPSKFVMIGQYLKHHALAGAHQYGQRSDSTCKLATLILGISLGLSDDRYFYELLAQFHHS